MLELRVARLEEDLRDIKTTLRAIEARLAGIELSVAEIKGRMAGLEGRMAGIEGRFLAVPTMWHLMTMMITTWSAGAAIVFALVKLAAK